MLVALVTVLALAQSEPPPPAVWARQICELPPTVDLSTLPALPFGAPPPDLGVGEFAPELLPGTALLAVHHGEITLDGLPWTGDQETPRRLALWISPMAPVEFVLDVLTRLDGAPVGLVGLAPPLPTTPDELRERWGALGARPSALERSWRQIGRYCGDLDALVDPTRSCTERATLLDALVGVPACGAVGYELLAAYAVKVHGPVPQTPAIVRTVTVSSAADSPLHAAPGSTWGTASIDTTEAPATLWLQLVDAAPSDPPAPAAEPGETPTEDP